MRVNLGEKYAVIYDQADLSERASRHIELAYIDAIQTAAKLNRMGKEFDTDVSVDDPDIGEKLESLYDGMPLNDVNRIRVYEAALIVNMVKEWNVLDDLPTSENVLDIPRGVFAKLAAECAAEFNRKANFSPDGATDPKAPTGN